jgi:hypothetical protein
MSQIKIHRFQPIVAKAFGIPAALIYQTILWRTQRASSGWVFVNLRQLEEEYRYLGRSTIWDGLERLRCGDRRHSSLLKRKPIGDAGYQYSTGLKVYPNDGAHAFNPAIAEELMAKGVTLAVALTAAVIYSNLRYWVLTRWKDLAGAAADSVPPEYSPDEANRLLYEGTADAAWHYGSIKVWAEQHSYTCRRVCEQAFAVLVKKNYLRKHDGRRGIHRWSLSKKRMHEQLCKWVDDNTLEIDSAYAGSTAHIPDQQRICRTDSAYTGLKHAFEPMDTSPNASSEVLSEAHIIKRKIRETTKASRYATSHPCGATKVFVKKDAFGNPRKRSYEKYDPNDWGEFEDWRVKRWQEESSSKPV